MNDNPQNLTNIQNPKTQEEQSRFDKFRSSPESAPASVTPPPPSQEPETSPPPEEPKKSNVKKSPFRFLPLIVMLAALSAAAYFGYENYILKMQQSSDPSPSPTVASSPTPTTSSEPTPRPELKNNYSNSEIIVTIRYTDGFTLQE